MKLTEMDEGMQIYMRWKGLSPKARFTKWAECEDPFLKMRKFNCGYESIKSMETTLEQVSESWALQQRTCTFFCYDEHNMRKPVRIVQFRIKFKES